MPKGETWIHQPLNFTDYLVLHLSIHPSISLSIHHRSFRFGEADKSEETINVFTLKGIPKGLSTAHHGAGKLSILSVSAWFENVQYLVVAWRRRPFALCACVELSFKQLQSGLLELYSQRDFAKFFADTVPDKIFEVFFMADLVGFSFLFVPGFFSTSQLPANFKRDSIEFLLLKLNLYLGFSLKLSFCKFRIYLTTRKLLRAESCQKPRSQSLGTGLE